MERQVHKRRQYYPSRLFKTSSSSSTIFLSLYSIISLCFKSFSSFFPLLALRVPVVLSNNSSHHYEFLPDEATKAVLPLHLHRGTLHVYLYVGSPPQRQILIVDTGSKFMSFPCAPFCTTRTCGKHASELYYDLNISTTHQIRKKGQCFTTGREEEDNSRRKKMMMMKKKTTPTMKKQKRKRTGRRTTATNDHPDYCNVKQLYVEGSFWDAYEVEDIVWLGTNDFEESMEIVVPLGAPYTFACQKEVQGLFMKQYADGILGLSVHETNFVRSLYSTHHILNRNAFSICVASNNQGSLALGGSLPTNLYHVEPMKYTKLIRKSGAYGVQLEAVYIGKTCITCHGSKGERLLNSLNDDRGTILDTGTTDTFLSSSLETPFIEEWLRCTKQARTNHSFLKRERRYSYDEFLKLCTVSLTFVGNVTLTMKPEHFMEGAIDNDATRTKNSIGIAIPWNGKRKLFNRLYIDENGSSVLGVNAMIGYDILYDDQGGQVGIAKANCPQE